MIQGSSSLATAQESGNLNLNYPKIHLCHTVHRGWWHDWKTMLCTEASTKGFNSNKTSDIVIVVLEFKIQQQYLQIFNRKLVV